MARIYRPTPKWVYDAERRERERMQSPVININICLDTNQQSTDLDRYLDILSRLREEMYKSTQIPRERFMK